MSLGARAFLKKLGVNFDKSHSALDNAFLKEFTEVEQSKIRSIWTQMHTFGGSPTQLYKVPTTQKQAALLFSHDRLRIIKSSEWIKQIVGAVNPNSIIEYGCGAGFLLQYLHHIFPNIQLSGVDHCDNLLNTIPYNPSIVLSNSNYHEFETENSFDLAICDFGWDVSDIPKSQREHSSEVVFGHPTCPGCTTDFEAFYFELLKAITKNINLGGYVALTGRFINASHKIAFYNALSSLKLFISKDHSSTLRIKHLDGQIESFPAYFISSKHDRLIVEKLEDFLRL